MKKRILSILFALLITVSTISVATIKVSAATGYDRGYSGGRAGTGSIVAHGLDVSVWQAGNIDFSAVKAAGYSYVILRAGYSGKKDTSFETFYSQAKAAGLDVGAYFYSYATTVADAYSDAQDTLNYIAGKKFEYPIYFDYEDSTQANLSDSLDISICLAYLDTIASAGYLAGIYSGKYFLTQYQINTICAKYEYWIPHYYDYGYTAMHSEYSTTTGMYQYTDRNYVNGKGPYDGDVCYKDYPAIVKQYGFNGYSAGPSAGEPSNLGDSFYARIYNPEYDKYVALRSDGALFAESKQLKQSQVWKFERNADDASYKITSTESGKNIDLVDSNSTPGTDIIVWEETGTDAQRWYLVSKNGGYVLQCKAAKSNALDIDNGGQTEIACWEEYGGVNQVFQIQTVSDPYELWAGAPANLGDSFYARIYNTEYNKYIGLEGDRPTALEKTSDSSQVWKFERQANDASYKIINTKNGKNLDLNGGNDTAGTDVVTYHDNGADNQRWYLVAKDGGYMLQSKCAKNNALDIDTGGQKWIANWAAHGGVNQLFNIQTVTGAYELSAGDSADLGNAFYARIYNSEFNKYIGLLEERPTALDATTDSSQIWKFERHSEDGSYKIINTLTGKVLELKNGDSTVGAEIITYNDIKSDAQRWYLVSKNGGYVLQCKAARTNALDIDTGGKSWIAAWEEYGGVNQIFQINKLNGGYTVRHYIQNIGGIASIKDENNYTLTDTVFVSSSSEADVTAALKSYAHRIAPNAVTVTPAADGSTLVEYFYSLMYGDVNEDNTVNASDIATLKKRLVNNENGSEMSNALSDLNGDGVINLKDMLRLKLYMADSSTKIGG